MASLRDKFRGCIAGSWIGSAMGAPVEGWPSERIQEAHGRLDRLLPYRHYTATTDWQRPPGTPFFGNETIMLNYAADEIRNRPYGNFMAGVRYFPNGTKH